MKIKSRLDLVKPFINEDTKRIKKVIEKAKKEIAIVCMTGDLAHPGHISYIKTIKNKIEYKFNKPIDIVVGLEDSERTLIRKGKRPILSNEERVYQWKHIKYIKDAFIWNTGKYYPSDLMLYLKPHYWATYQEYFPDIASYLHTYKKFKKNEIRTKMIVITEKDIDALPEGNVRKKWELSSSNITKKIIVNQKDKVLELLKDYYEKDIS